MMTNDFNPYDTPLLFFLVTIVFAVIYFISAVNNHKGPTYHSDTGARYKGGWSTDDKRNRKRRQYNRRKADEARSIGDYEKAEYYDERAANSWSDIPYEKDTYANWKKRKDLDLWASIHLKNKMEIENQIINMLSSGGKGELTPIIEDDKYDDKIPDSAMKVHKKKLSDWINMYTEQFGGKVTSLRSI